MWRNEDAVLVAVALFAGLEFNAAERDKFIDSIDFHLAVLVRMRARCLDAETDSREVRHSASHLESRSPITRAPAAETALPQGTAPQE